MNEEKKYLSEINFSELLLWDVKRYINQYLKKEEGYVYLKDILTQYKNKLPKEKIIKEKLRIVKKINFGGKLFLRDFEDVHTYKGRPLEVPENSILYSKINVRHGCVYYHEKGKQSFGVSNEYPIFTFNNLEISGNYLHMILRSQKVKDYLNSLTTGISKARVKVDEFLSIPIPLPSLLEQNIIVERFNQKISDAKNAEKKSQELEKNIEEYLMDELGIEKMEVQEKKKGLQEVRFKDCDIWGINNVQFGFIKSFEKVKYPKYKISELCNIGSGGTPNRSRRDYYEGKIPWIKTGEVRENIIFDTGEKITELGIENSSAKLFPKGSLILAMYGATAGRTAKLGIESSTNQACAVLFNFSKKINTDFFWLYLQSQVENFKSISTGSAQPNLSAEKIKNYPIPLPSLEIQAKIVEKISAIKTEIKELKNLAEEKRKNAIGEFEGEIFSA